MGNALREFSRVLYLQQPHVLDQQMQRVVVTLEKAFPGMHVDFASSAEHVAQGCTYDAVITPTLPWLPDVLAKVGNRPWIHFQSAGVEKIWSMKFDKHLYQMSKSSGIHALPMSEYAIGAMLYFAKRFDQYVEQSRQKIWSRSWLEELTGRNLLVLGLGNVGQAVAARALVFGMDVAGVRNNPLPVPGVTDVRTIADAMPLVNEADYVVVTLPLTDSTRNLVDAEFVRQLKPGAVLVDVSRGGVVDSTAILEGVKGGTLRGAALDVFPEEPLAADSPLWSRQKILITPHVAGTTPEYVDRVLDIFVRNAKAHVQFAPLPNSVDIGLGY